MSSIAINLLILLIGVFIGFFYRELFRVAGPACLALALFWPSPAAAECLPSLHAARELHPTGHISWSGGCYFAGYPSQRHASRLDGKREAKAVPLPKDRPAKFGRAVPHPDEEIAARNVSTIERLAEQRRIADRMLSVCFAPGGELADEGKKLLAKAMWAKMAEAGR